MDELYEYTDDNGDLLPGIWSTSMPGRDEDADKNLYYVNAVQPEEGQEGSSGDPIKPYTHWRIWRGR